jgi:hypothetical protein
MEQSVRDGAMTALILGFFASSWFGWAQERPPAGWRRPLIAGAVLAMAFAAAGGVLAWQNWSGASALDQPGAMRQFGIIAGIEFGVAAVGAIVLAVRGHSEYTAPWICLVVGVHFLPLAPLLDNPLLVALGAVLCAVAVTAVLVSRRTNLASSAIAGVGAGVALLGVAVVGLVTAV